jgi:alcohol dehydrogenase YqhD (iron-dependent ADH family)
MFDFTCYNPVRILFGRGTIARLADLVPENARLLLVYGGGSIIDTAKFIAVAIPCAGEEPWDMVEKKAPRSRKPCPWGAWSPWRPPVRR